MSPFINYAVIDNVTRKINKIYGVVDGTTRLIWSENDDGIQLLSSGVVYSIAIDEGQYPTFMYNYDSSSTSLDDKLIELPIDSLSWQYSADLNYYININTYQAKLYKYNNSTSSYSTLIQTINTTYPIKQCRWHIDKLNFAIVLWDDSANNIIVQCYDNDGALLKQYEHSSCGTDISSYTISGNLETICCVTHTSSYLYMDIIHTFNYSESILISNSLSYVVSIMVPWISWNGIYVIFGFVGRYPTSASTYTTTTMVSSYIINDTSITTKQLFSVSGSSLPARIVHNTSQDSIFAHGTSSSAWYGLSQEGVTCLGTFSNSNDIGALSYNDPSYALYSTNSYLLDGTYKNYNTGSVERGSAVCLQKISWNSNGLPSSLSTLTQQVCSFTGELITYDNLHWF